MNKVEKVKLAKDGLDVYPDLMRAARDMDGAVVRPELDVEVSFDHTSNERIRHGTKLLRWRDDKDPRDCTMDQLDS